MNVFKSSAFNRGLKFSVRKGKIGPEIPRWPSPGASLLKISPPYQTKSNEAGGFLVASDNPEIVVPAIERIAVPL